MNARAHAIVLATAAAGLLATAGATEEAVDDAQATPSEEGETIMESLAPRPVAGGTAARRLNQAVPQYPKGAKGRRQEGWVVLSFVVDADGKVVEPVVEDSSGVAEFEKAALASIMRTEYAPATWNGKPVQQCAANMRYIFMMPGTGKGARRSFARDFRQVTQLAGEGKADEAFAALAALQEKGSWNLYESTRLFLLSASFQEAKGDKAGALESLQRATFNNGVFMERNLYREALVDRFRLESTLGHYGAALETHAEMGQLKPPIRDERVERVAAQIRAAVDSPNLIPFPGTIEFRSGCEEGRANWKHELLRRRFAFNAADAGVEEFQLRCDWKMVSDKVATDRIWDVPESWGLCQVFVFGEIGAKVTLVEYPAAATP